MHSPKKLAFLKNIIILFAFSTGFFAYHYVSSLSVTSNSIADLRSQPPEITQAQLDVIDLYLKIPLYAPASPGTYQSSSSDGKDSFVYLFFWSGYPHQACLPPRYA